MSFGVRLRKEERERVWAFNVYQKKPRCAAHALETFLPTALRPRHVRGRGAVRGHFLFSCGSFGPKCHKGHIFDMRHARFHSASPPRRSTINCHGWDEWWARGSSYGRNSKTLLLYECGSLRVFVATALICVIDMFVCHLPIRHLKTRYSNGFCHGYEYHLHSSFP